jgi:hypothetical protein
MISEFCEQILKNAEYAESEWPSIIYHPHFTKKIVYDYPNGARGTTPVHWNYELQSSDRPGSKLICYDKDDNEVPCDSP